MTLPISAGTDVRKLFESCTHRTLTQPHTPTGHVSKRFTLRFKCPNFFKARILAGRE